MLLFCVAKFFNLLIESSNCFQDKLSEIPNSNTNDVKRVNVSQYNIHDYPLQAVTKVALNPNLQFNKMYATGHQAGFVRLRSITFVKNNSVKNAYADFNLAESL